MLFVISIGVDFIRWRRLLGGFSCWGPGDVSLLLYVVRLICGFWNLLFFVLVLCSCVLSILSILISLWIGRLACLTNCFSFMWCVFEFVVVV